MICQMQSLTQLLRLDSQPGRSVVTQIDRSAGREYNEKYIIHNGVFWVGDIGDMDKRMEASYDTPHFFLSQTKTIEEHVHSKRYTTSHDIKY